VVNDSTVEAGAMGGFDASVSESVIGAESIVAMGSVIPPGYEVPPESFVRGTPARVGPLSDADIDRDAGYDQDATGSDAHLTDDHAELLD